VRELERAVTAAPEFAALWRQQSLQVAVTRAIGRLADARRGRRDRWALCYSAASADRHHAAMRAYLTFSDIEGKLGIETPPSRRVRGAWPRRLTMSTPILSHVGLGA
jgi:hypothetical protein